MAVKVAATGNAPATGMPKTPAPTRQAPPDAVSEIRNPSAQSYGENGPKNNVSRTNPGQVVESDLARNLRQSSDDGESVLDAIQSKGMRALGQDWQTRSVSDTPFKPAFGMKSPAAPATIPSKIGGK
jgi:hypothetical protein